jgi:hypothetical protein
MKNIAYLERKRELFSVKSNSETGRGADFGD